MTKWVVLALVPVLLLLAIFVGLLMLPLLFMGSTTIDNLTDLAISAFGKQEIPAQYIPIYRAAAAKYGVPWNLLAAHHRVETRFSTVNPMISPHGAEGHMQFMPCTWVGWSAPGCSGAGRGSFTAEEKTSLALIARYGGYGVDANNDGKADMWDITDAIFTAAKYLSAHGAAAGKIEQAVYAYNPVQSYVAEVMKYANLYADAGVVSVSAGGFARPLNTDITSGFGYRVNPLPPHDMRLHAGIDFACTIGQPIPAARGGTVVWAGWQDPSNPKVGYGQYVRVDHGGGLKSTYGHLSAIQVRVGDHVEVGSVVGACGTTGSSTGTHLHFEILVNGSQENPAPFLGL